MFFKIFLYLSFAVFSTATHAKHVLPVFSGKWFTDLDYSYMDSCSKQHFNYNNLVNSPTENIVENIIKYKNPRNDCRWTSPKVSTNKPQFHPLDFPGTEEDWQRLLDDSSYEKEQNWSSECIDKNGDEIDLAYVTFYPKYECPKGSRFSINISNIIRDKGDDYGCSTTPDTCVSDVVGRDLNVVGLGSMGHIGLIEPGNRVIEVLNESPVVQENAIDDFRGRSSYWGEKYGLQESEDLTDEQGLQIFVKANSQMGCKIKYTAKWKYKPCKKNDSGYFRCDSFIYYAYQEGAKLKIGEFIPFITFPSTLYSRFSHCRIDGTSSCREIESGGTFAQEQLPPLTASNLFSSQITSELAKSNTSIMMLDKLTDDYVASQEIPRIKKIIFLWDLLKRYKAEHNRFLYIQRTLSDLEPHEIISEIIYVYQQETDLYVKKELIDLLYHSASARNLKKGSEKFNEAYLFFKNTLLNEREPEIAAELISFYPQLFLDSETYQIIIDKIGSLKKQNVDPFSDSIAYNSTFWGKLIQFMIDEKGRQVAWFEKISALAEKYSEDPDFKTHFPLRIKQQYRHNDFLVSDMFYISLRNFMKAIKPGELEPDTIKKINYYLENRIKIRPLPRSNVEEYQEAIRAIIKREEEKRDKFNEMQKQKIIETNYYESGLNNL